MSMSHSRHVSLAMRSSLLMTAGLGLIAAPFLLGLGAAALVSGVTIGAATVALGLAGTESSGRGTLSAAVHADYDRGLALGLVLAALMFAVAGEPVAALVFGTAGLAALIVTTLTRYSARPI
jgi:hypothetical protein